VVLEGAYTTRISKGGVYDIFRIAAEAIGLVTVFLVKYPGGNARRKWDLYHAELQGMQRFPLDTIELQQAK